MSRSQYRGKKPPQSSNALVLVLVVVLFLLVLFLLGLLFLGYRTQLQGEVNTPPSSAALLPSPSSPLPSPLPSYSTTSTPPPSPSPSSSPSDPVESDSSDPDELWYLTLVNPTHSLPEDFSVDTEPIYTTLRFDSRAVGALREMLAACQAAGLQPLVCSAYRTQETQEKLFQNKVNEFIALGYAEDDAIAAAGRIVAVPGTSEHQLGLAADIVDATHQALDESQEDTAVQKWLMEHCWEYGFILRYPNEKSAQTGIIYEPWHYRYVGKEIAQDITESDLCLEEYLLQEYAIA